MLVAVVVFEELLYRGIILRYAELWLGSWLALGLSSLLFALAHFWAGPAVGRGRSSSGSP